MSCRSGTSQSTCRRNGARPGLGLSLPNAADGYFASCPLRGHKRSCPESQLAKLWTPRPIPGGLIGPGSPIAIRPAIALDLAADGGRRSSQVARDRPQRALHAEPSRDLLSFRKAERLFGSVPSRRADATGWRDHREDRPSGSPLLLFFACRCRPSACWHFCWHRQQLATKTISNSISPRPCRHFE